MKISKQLGDELRHIGEFAEIMNVLLSASGALETAPIQSLAMAQHFMQKPMREQTVQKASSRANFLIKFAMAVIGIGLIGLGIWGFWASADFAHQVATTDVFGGEQLSEVAAVFIWFVIFAPCLGGGAALLWSTFAPEDNSWLSPLGMFNFILGIKIMRETRRRDVSEGACIDVLPLNREEKLLRSHEDAVQHREDS